MESIHQFPLMNTLHNGSFQKLPKIITSNYSYFSLLSDLVTSQSTNRVLQFHSVLYYRPGHVQLQVLKMLQVLLSPKPK